MTDATNLELLVLAMVQLGLETPYDLKAKAGLSLGSTIPLLARLTKAGLLKASDPDRRNSRKYSVTREGASALRHGWKPMLKPGAMDADSILRIAYLAWQGGARAEGVKFLRDAAGDLDGLVGTRKAEAVRLRAALSQPVPGPESYRWFRMEIESDRLAAEATGLRRLAKQLDSKNNKKKTQAK